MPRIVFRNNEHPPVDLNEPLTIGRSEKHANVVVKDTRLSRAHCRFERREDAWTVVDLESQNGTFVNGKRVKESRLKVGDVVTIGAVDMAFDGQGGPSSGIMEGATDPAEFDDPQATATLVAPAALMLIQGSLTDKIHPITHDPFTIGRKPDNHLCLVNDGKSSGYHARIRREGDDYVLEDLGSTNGSLVNGTKIEQPVILKTGMKLVLGSQVFRFQLHGRPNESSGHTVPMSASELQQRREQMEQPAAPMESELDAAEAEDRAALTQKIKFSGGSGIVFAVLEVLVVLLVAGAALFAAWTMTTGDTGSTGDEGGNYPPARDGGLLAANASFDDRDEGGFPRGWRYLVSGTDNFTLAEGAKGGQYGLQIGRFTPGNRVSLAISDSVELKAGGLAVSAFALNPEFDNDRLGTALVQVWWLAHPRDREPMLVSPIAAATGLKEWTELTGAAKAPAGARAFSIAVGISGNPGSVMFDELLVTADDSAPAWFGAHRMDSPSGVSWHISPTGTIELADASGPLIKGGRILLYAAEGHDDPLDPLHTLLADPKFEKSGTSLFAELRYFDPLAGAALILNLEFGGKSESATLIAKLDMGAVTDATPASRYVSFSGLATPRWMPSQIVRFAPGNDVPREFADEIGAGQDRAEFGRLLAADTGTGNIIETIAAPARATVVAAGGGRELLLQAPQLLSLRFTPTRGQQEIQRPLELVGAVQPGEDQLDRVRRALSIMLDYPYNQAATTAAANAVDAASKHYRLRLIELRDGINVPQLTRNEQLYRSAMEEAISTADRLRTASGVWDGIKDRVNEALDHAGMNQRTRESARKANSALTALIQVAAEFDSLAERARKSLFLLEVDIEQRDSEPYMASARDFLDSGQYVQGMLKLSTVVQRYPRCLRGIEAKERLADVAAILLNEMDDFNKQGLQNIAHDRALQARELIRTVQQNLLGRLLNDKQREWLRDVPHSAEAPPSSWLQRESELTRRLLALNDQLPKDLQE